MSRKLIQETNLQNIAAAIRAKNGGNSTYKPREMADAIRALPSPGTLVPKAITQNGSYSPASENADGFSSVTVNVGRNLVHKNITRNGSFSAASDHVDGFSSVSVDVPNSYNALDEGKVVSSGSLSEQTSRTVTQNGTFDTTRNNQVTVNVSDDTTLVSKTITANGTYHPADDNADGYSSVSVAVPNSALSSTDEGKVVVNGALMPQTSLSVTANGTYDTTDKNSVVVNVSEGAEPDPFAGLNDYIRSSGTQWINTGYVLTLNSEVELIVDLLGSSGNYTAICGTEDGTISECYVVFDRYTGGFRSPTTGILVAAGNNTRSLSVQYSPSIPGYVDVNTYFFNEKIQIKGKLNENFMVYSHMGRVLSTPLSGFAGCAYPLWLFDVNTSGSHNPYLSYCVAKLYACRFYESGTLTMELLPHQENGVVCLKDTVSGNLFYNQGTGDFIFGTDSQ